MKKMSSYLILVLSALIIAAPFAFAEQGPMARCNLMCKHEKELSKMDLDEKFLHKAHFILANAEEIGLTDEQEEKIKVLKLTAKKSRIKSEADIELLALDIQAELAKDDINLNAINSLIDKKYAVKTQKAKDLAAAYVNLKKVLTKEQQEKLKDIWLSSVQDKKGMPTKHRD